MPTKTEGNTSSSYWKTRTWSRSPRIGGKLLLSTNQMRSDARYLYGVSGPVWATQYLTDSNGESSVTSTSSVASAAYAVAYDRFRAKVWGDAQTMLAVDLAERKATLQMLTSSCLRVLRAARLVLRGKFHRAARALAMDRPPKDIRKGIDPTKVFADNWLAYRYGWTPLYSSIYNTLEVLDKTIENRFVRASGRAQLDTKSSISTQDVTYRREARVVIKASMLVTNPDRARLKQYGVLNPLEVVWELVPFSFVADWFLPIGSYLEDMTSFAGLSFTNGSITYHGQLHREKLYTRSYLDWKGSTHGQLYIYKQRVVTNSFAPPARPILTNGLNTKRAIDAISLLRTLLSGRSK